MWIAAIQRLTPVRVGVLWTNQIDLLPEDEREARILQAQKVIRQSLKGSKFVNAPMVCLSAAVGGEKVAAVGSCRPRGGGGAAATATPHTGEAAWSLETRPASTGHEASRPDVRVVGGVVLRWRAGRG